MDVPNSIFYFCLIFCTHGEVGESQQIVNLFPLGE